MPNTLYPTGRSRFASGDADWDSDTFRVFLLDDTYTYDAAHEFASSLSGILGTPMDMTGNVVLADGVCDSDSLSYMGVDIGETITRIVIAKWTGSSATSPLIYYADTNNDTTPMSRAGNGAAVPLIWSTAGSHIFKL